MFTVRSRTVIWINNRSVRDTIVRWIPLEIKSNRTPLLPVVSELHTMKLLSKHLNWLTVNSACFRNYQRWLMHNSNCTLPKREFKTFLPSFGSVHLLSKKRHFFVLMAPQHEWKNEQRKWTELQISFQFQCVISGRAGSSWLHFMNLAFVSGQNFAANGFSCFIITSLQLKEKYLSFEALN